MKFKAQAQTDESVIADLTKRVQGLLEANNALVERERDAKRRAEAAERAFITARDELFAAHDRLMALEETVSRLREQAGQAIILEGQLDVARKELEELKDVAVVPPKLGHVFWLSLEGRPFLYINDGWEPAKVELPIFKINSVNAR